MGYVVAGEVGWMVGDPTLTDDGPGIPIGLGILVIVIIVGAFLAFNIPIARQARIPPSRWIPTAVGISLVTAIAVASQLYR